MASLAVGDDAVEVLEEREIHIYGIKPCDFFKNVDKKQEFLDKMKKVNKTFIKETSIIKNRNLSRIDSQRAPANLINFISNLEKE